MSNMLIFRAMTLLCMLVAIPSLAAGNPSVFSADGKTIATVSEGTSVVVLQDETRVQTVKVMGHNGAIHSIRFSPDGTQLLSASDDGTAKLWSVQSGKLLATLPMASGVLDARFSGDGQRILTRSKAGKLALWFTSDGSSMDSFGRFEDVSQAEISSNGSRVLATLSSGRIEIWDEYSNAIRAVIHSEDVKIANGDELPEASPVAATLQDWAMAWSRQDADKYLDFYSSSFTPSNEQSLDTWRAQRRDRVSAPSSINVSLDDLEVKLANGSVILASFRQHYQSDRLSDVCFKQIALAAEPEGYRITSETTVSCH